jgi:predicted DNA-binding protein
MVENKTRNEKLHQLSPSRGRTTPTAVEEAITEHGGL